MSLSATYNGVVISPLLFWTKATTPNLTFDGKRVLNYTTVYTVRGFFNNTTAAARKADFDTLISKFNENGKLFKITQDAVDIETLDPTDVPGDQPHARFLVPDHFGDKLKMGFNVPFTLRVEGKLDATSGAAILAHSFTTTVTDDKEGFTTRTRRGQLKTAVGGGGASNQLAGVLPAIPAGFERESLTQTIDDEDLILNYVVVDTEKKAASNPTTAQDLNYSTSISIQDGTEVWTLAGLLHYGPKQTINKADVKTLRGREFPGGVKVVSEDTESNPRENTLRFTIIGERAYGQQNTLEYENTVTTTSRRIVRDFKSIARSGNDIRQELTRPDHVITQTGRRVSSGGYGSFPIKVGVAADEIERTEEFGDIFYGVDGRGARFPIRWTYVFRPLNRVQPGSLAPAQANQSSDPITGKTSTVKASV